MLRSAILHKLTPMPYLPEVTVNAPHKRMAAVPELPPYRELAERRGQQIPTSPLDGEYLRQRVVVCGMSSSKIHVRPTPSGLGCTELQAGTRNLGREQTAPGGYCFPGVLALRAVPEAKGGQYQQEPALGCHRWLEPGRLCPA